MEVEEAPAVNMDERSNEEKEEKESADVEKVMKGGDGEIGPKQHESSSESDSDSDDGDDNEEDSKIANEVKKLEEYVAENPFVYDGHLKLISTLRKAGYLEKLRAAREAMNLLYPLTPTIWMEWAIDEGRLATGAEEVRAVEALYERGTKDYLSVPLWLEYLKFVEEHDASVAGGTPEGISKMRNLYERALAAVGLHFTEGLEVWEAYREFEQTVLFLLDQSGAEGKAKQVENVRNLFRRQLTIPLSNLPVTLQEYKDWEDEQGNHIGDGNDPLAGLPTHVCAAYKKAIQLCSIRVLHEEKIARGKPGEDELLQYYLGYVSIEEATGEPVRAQVLYERAISEFPVTQDIWVKYTQYLETNLKVASVLNGVYARAVQNCPWVEPLWKSYLLSLERSQASENQLSAVFEQSLQGGFSSAQEYLDLFLCRCDGLRRRIMRKEESPDRQADVALLHDTFDRASQFLSTYYPDFVDRTLQLHAYWADMEVYVVKDLVAARGVWEGLIKSSGWVAEVWQGYISMEISLKNIKEARAIYRSCYSRRLEGNGTELMCSAWLRFEREHGSLEDYDRAVMKVAPRLAEVQSMQLQQEAKSMQTFIEPTTAIAEGNNKTREQPNKTTTQENSSESVMGKRKRGVGFKEPKPVLKRSKFVRDDETQKAGMTVSNTNSKDEDKGKLMESIGTSQKKGGTTEAVQESSPRLSKTPRQYTDECTAFISRLPFEVTEEQVRDFFSPDAKVKEVRLLRDKFTGRLKGLAYVDFEDPESLAAAIKKDNEELGGRQLSIARSNPTSSRGGGRSGAGGRGDVYFHDEYENCLSQLDDSTILPVFLMRKQLDHTSSASVRERESTLCILEAVSNILSVWSIILRQGDISNDSPKKNVVSRALTLVQSLAPCPTEGSKQSDRGGRQVSRGRGQDNRGRGSGRTHGGIGHRRGGKVSITGSNTFAVPRAVVRPLGWNAGQAAAPSGDEVPKSNSDFREMLSSK